MSRPWYSELYDHFPDYDEEPYTQRTGPEVDFVEGVIEADRAQAILDVGCGTGRHTLELARRGYRVAGVDLSETLLTQARQTAANEGLDVRFFAEDARSLDFNAEFDVAMSLCEGAFSLMETDEMDRQILRGMHRALRPAGRLILTCPSALAMIAKNDDGSFDLGTFRESFQIESRYAAGETQMLDCTQRYYTCPELRYLLETLGFDEIEFFAAGDDGYRRGVLPGKADFEMGFIARKK